MLGGLIATVAILLMRLDDPHNAGAILDEEGLVHFRDLQIIGLIFGTLMLVDVSQESGVFHYISVKILKLSNLLFLPCNIWQKIAISIAVL